jgi:hypothetical protein
MVGSSRLTLPVRLTRLEEALIWFDFEADSPSGAKARVDFASFAARLKPSPFKAET